MARRSHKLHREEMICLVSTLVKQYQYHYQSCAGVAAVNEDFVGSKVHHSSFDDD